MTQKQKYEALKKEFERRLNAVIEKNCKDDVSLAVSHYRLHALYGWYSERLEKLVNELIDNCDIVGDIK